MSSPERDLAAWIPRLIAVFRQARKRPAGPGDREDRLQPDELREAAAAVKRLSQGLTRARELAGASYMDDPKLLAGYLLFYWPVSYAQGRHLLTELGSRPRSVLDLGSGPGPLAFAALDAGAREVTAADRSVTALERVRQLAIEADEAIATRPWDAQKPLPDGTYDLITAGHLINELWSGDPKGDEKRVALLERFSNALTPNGHILLIEPALRDTSRGLLRLRDRLRAQGFQIASPCLFTGPCPALEKETDWCHAERNWEPPAMVQEIAQRAGLHKEALKMSYLLLRKKGAPEAPLPSNERLFRIVSEPLTSKGRLRYMGCGPEGRRGISLQEKHLTEQNQPFEKLARGEVIAITGTEERGDGLALGADSTVTVKARPGQPVR